MHRSVRLYTLGVALAALAIISYHLLPSARAAASAGDSDLARLSNPDWTTPIAPFRIVGNLYYVGSRDLASYLIVTGAGDILINSNLEESVPQIRSSIEQLGQRFSDIRVLLISHAHWDHDAGSAELKRRSRPGSIARAISTTYVSASTRSRPSWHGRARVRHEDLRPTRG